MARNGSGTYNRIAGTPYVYNTVIDQAVVNSEFDDIATALTNSIAKDGQTTPTADLPMGTYKHTGVGAAAARTQYARAAEVQDGSLTHLTSVAGTDTITASAALSMTAYAVGQCFEFIPANTNTGAATLNINSIGAGAVQLNGAAIASGTIRQNVPIRVKVTATTPVFEIIGNGAFRQGLAASGANTDITSLAPASPGTINNMAIGGTTPKAGTFSALTSQGLLDISGASAGQIKFPGTQNASADVNTLDDYREGTFTATLTGCTTSPTATVQYVKTGKNVTLTFGIAPFIAGTSNASTKTLTGMPAALYPAIAHAFIADTVDNGGANVFSYATIATNGVITITNGPAGGAWTSSGACNINPMPVSYVAAA